MNFKKEDLVKSPLNYVGGKYKLLPQILPYFPEDINTFVDLFAGGCNVGINVTANKIICNDIIYQIMDLISYWSEQDIEKLICEINNVILKYELSQSCLNGYEFYGCNSNNGLSKYNNSKWRKLRDDYNKTKDIKLLYPVIIYTFNNNIKFDCTNNFTAGGCNKRDFNKSLQNNFSKFICKLKTSNVFVTKDNFLKFNFNDLNENDLVYCDPPYLITDALYNKLWGEEKEFKLLELLDKLNNKGVRFALSNVLENKGRCNDILKEWAKKYNIHYLNNTYGNCNYQTKDKSNNSTVEVLITNY